MIELDSTDLGILRLLQQDAKYTIKEIAEQLHLTTTPVYERIKRLEKDGYIQKYVALLDKEMLGKGMTAFCSVSLKEHAKAYLEMFESDVLELSEVMECYHIAGMFDYLLKVAVADMKEYQTFVTQKLSSLQNIGNVQSFFVMNEIKYTLALDF